ncbi:MAG TPA: DUF4163 domain-containing protein, partial [Rhizomicrobium sp.]|nr:DUF4163 domain-containing protein [Rhizomicrobium sp.]
MLGTSDQKASARRPVRPADTGTSPGDDNGNLQCAPFGGHAVWHPLTMGANKPCVTPLLPMAARLSSRRAMECAMRKIILAVLLLTATAAQAQLAVTDKAITRKTGRLHLDIHYPVTGKAALDRLFDRRNWVKVNPNDLKRATAHEPYSVSVSYKIKRNDAQMLSVQFDSYVYTGGAHGRPKMESFNFLMPEGQQVWLSDLVDGNRGLERVRDLVVADLNRQ